MSNQEVMKMQTCVLRVNIHCHGCEHKVKKLLNQTQGVYMSQIDAGQGKVTVTGNIDPATLIRKLEKSGKHAELWIAPKNITDNHNQSNLFLNNQLMNTMQQTKKPGSGGGNGKGNQLKLGGFGQNHPLQQQYVMNMKGQNGKDPRFTPGNQKKVKFKLPEAESDMGSDDLDDNDDDIESDGGDCDDGYGHHKGGSKQQGDGGKDKKIEVVDKKGCGKKVGVFDIQGLMKALGKGRGGGGNGKKGKKVGKDVKNGGGKANRGGGDGGGGKKGGVENGKNKGKDDGINKMMHQQDLDGFNQMMTMSRGNNGGYPEVEGLPAAAGMNGGGNPPYMGMTMMNHHHHQLQHQLSGVHNNNNGEIFHTMTYARSHPPPSMPPPSSSDPFVHMFSDENTNSCSVM